MFRDVATCRIATIDGYCGVYNKRMHDYYGYAYIAPVCAPVAKQHESTS